MKIILNELRLSQEALDTFNRLELFDRIRNNYPELSFGEIKAILDRQEDKNTRRQGSN